MAIRLSPQEDALDEIHEIHQINVTPFIDVIVDLPASTANPAPRPDKSLFLTVKPDLTLALGESPIERGNLASALDAETQGDKDHRVFVRADRVVPYGEVMELMNLLRGAGYLKIGLVGMEAARANSATPGEPVRAATETKSPEARPPEMKP